MFLKNKLLPVLVEQFANLPETVFSKCVITLIIGYASEKELFPLIALIPFTVAGVISVGPTFG
jgi:hypothetical protein